MTMKDCQIVSDLLAAAHAQPIMSSSTSTSTSSARPSCCGLPPSIAQCSPSSSSSSESETAIVTSLTLTPATVSFQQDKATATDQKQASSFLVPLELGQLAALQVLVLSSPTLSGPIPPSIRQLKQLKQISIWNSLINGSIPDIFDSSFTRLSSIHIFDNPNLTGPIPPSLVQIPNLQTLDLSGNRLSSIPATLLANLPASLRDMSITGNNFTGPLPPLPSQTLSRCDLATFNSFTCLTSALPPSCSASNKALASLPLCDSQPSSINWPLGAFIALGAACAILVVAGVGGARVWTRRRMEKRAMGRARSAVALVELGESDGNVQDRERHV